jgi:hypothetical protein
VTICDSVGDFATGELDAEQDDTFREHLATCARCQRELESTNCLIAMLSEMPISQVQFVRLHPDRFVWRWSWLWMRWEVTS